MFLSFLVVSAVLSPAVVPSDQFHWQGRLPSGQSIEVKGVYGSIRAEPAQGDRAEVLAYQEGSTFSPDGVGIDLEQRADGITFSARYPQPGLADRTAGHGARVDFVVRVPKGVRFIGRTVNGSVEARSLGSDAAAYTVNGNVRMSTAGEARAETVNGSITASMGSTSFHRTLKFSTVNGGITLEMPRCVNANIHARTLHGGISTQFRMPVETRSAGRRANGNVGKGGSEVNLTTVNGDIRLLRSATLPL